MTPDKIDDLAQRIARALPATINGRGSDDDKAIAALYAAYRNEMGFTAAARRAQTEWVAEVIQEVLEAET